ncbi:MAG: zinc-ribbon domain-containing protein, partial [Clostridia bacterium]|nr:zinc-ribbon domain-containing protein [Clostridia bacterium]
MRFCPNCGSQVPDTSKFCTECGEKLTVVAHAPEEQCVEPAFEVPAAPVIESVDIPE